MIATDIAARGIDINELPLVINYDLPDVPGDACIVSDVPVEPVI